MAHPFNKRLPISADAMSLCWRRRIDSGVSTGGAKVGELKVLENSVGGVEAREGRDEVDTLPEVEHGGTLCEAATSRRSV